MGLRKVGHAGAFGSLLSLGCLLMIALFIIGPTLLIWSINMLWHTNLEINFWNWVAAFVFMFCLRGSVSSK